MNAQQASSRRALVIDPDRSFGDFVLETLSSHDFEVHALDVHEIDTTDVAGSADIVFLAVDLPEKAGFALCTRLKKKRRSLPIVVITSTLDESETELHSRLTFHADAYLDKGSLQPQDLLREVDRLIGLPDYLDDEPDDEVPPPPTALPLGELAEPGVHEPVLAHVGGVRHLGGNAPGGLRRSAAVASDVQGFVATLAATDARIRQLEAEVERSESRVAQSRLGLEEFARSLSEALQTGEGAGGRATLLLDDLRSAREELDEARSEIAALEDAAAAADEEAQSTLAEERARFEASRDQQLLEAAELEQTLREELEARETDHRNEYAVLAGQLTSLEEQLQSQTEALETLQAELDAAQSERAADRTTAEELVEQQRAVHANEMARLELELEKERAQIAALHEAERGHVATHSQQQLRIAELEALAQRARQMPEAMAELELQLLEKSRARALEHEAQVTRYEAQLAALKEEIGTLKQLASRQTERRERRLLEDQQERDAERAEYESRLERLVLDLERHRKDAERARAECDEMERRYRSADDEVKTVRQTAAQSLSDQAAQHAEEKSRMQAAIVQANARGEAALIEAEARHQTEIAALRRELGVAAARFGEEEAAELAVLRVEHERTRQRHKGLETEHARVLAELDTLQREHQRLLSAGSDREAEGARRETLLEALRADKDRLLAAAEGSQAEHERVLAAYRALQTENERLLPALHALQTENQRLLPALQALQTENEHVAAAHEELKIVHEELQTALRALRLEHETLESSHEAELQELHRELDSERAELQRRYEADLERLGREHSEIQALRTELEERLRATRQAEERIARVEAAVADFEQFRGILHGLLHEQDRRLADRLLRNEILPAISRITMAGEGGSS